MNEEPLLLPAPETPLLLPAPKPSPGDGSHDGPNRRLIVIAVIVVVVLALVGWFFHHHRASQAREANERTRDRLPSVDVTEVKTSPSTAELLLPGSLSPITEASLYARASGYLRERYVDIGDPVKRGQILAEIDSPDLDQQVVQARAAVAQARQQLGQAQANVADAKARVALARVTAQRTDALVRDEAVAQQEADQRRQELDTAQANLTSGFANVGASQENVRAGEANSRRLVVLQDYEKMRAPFDGIVTVRNIDVGALISASGGASSSTSMGNTSSSEGASTSTGGSGSSSAFGASSSGGTQGSASGQSGELFRIAQIDRLRVFVSVPQENASAVVTETGADVLVSGFDEPFAGRVTRTARSIDPGSRTLLVEVQIPNARHVLMPGMYAQVRFRSPRENPPLLVPGEAVIARKDGVSIATIQDLRPEDRQRLPKPEKRSKDDDQPQDPNDARRIHLQKVRLGRDYGTEVEVMQGLRPGTVIVSNPGDEVAEDALVVPHKREGNGDAQGGSGDDKAPSGNQSPSMKAPTKGKS